MPDFMNNEKVKPGANTNANKNKSYQENLARPVQQKWYAGEQPTSMEMWGRIGGMMKTNPDEARTCYGAMRKMQMTKGSPYYNPYITATSSEVTAASLLNTQNAQREWNAYQDELRYWTKANDRNYTNDEIINMTRGKDDAIFKEKYPTLYAMDKSRQTGKNIVQLNEAIGYSSDAVQGVLWNARNDSDDPIEVATMKSAMGVGNQWQDNPELRAKLNWQSEEYSPYSVGSTLEAERVYFNMPSFDRQWCIDHRDEVYASGDATKIKMYENVADAVTFTEKAQEERDLLYKEIDKLASSYATKPEKLIERLKEDKRFSELFKMDETMVAGSLKKTDLVGTSGAIDYRWADAENYLREKCDNYKNRKALSKTLGLNPDETQTSTEEVQNKNLDDAGDVINKYGTASEQRAYNAGRSGDFTGAVTYLKGKPASAYVKTEKPALPPKEQVRVDALADAEHNLNIERGVWADGEKATVETVRGAGEFKQNGINAGMFDNQSNYKDWSNSKLLKETEALRAEDQRIEDIVGGMTDDERHKAFAEDVRKTAAISGAFDKLDDVTKGKGDVGTGTYVQNGVDLYETFKDGKPEDYYDFDEDSAYPDRQMYYDNLLYDLTHGTKNGYYALAGAVNGYDTQSDIVREASTAVDKAEKLYGTGSEEYQEAKAYEQALINGYSEGSPEYIEAHQKWEEAQEEIFELWDAIENKTVDQYKADHPEIEANKIEAEKLYNRNMVGKAAIKNEQKEIDRRATAEKYEAEAANMSSEISPDYFKGKELEMVGDPLTKSLLMANTSWEDIMKQMGANEYGEAMMSDVFGFNQGDGSRPYWRLTQEEWFMTDKQRHTFTALMLAGKRDEAKEYYESIKPFLREQKAIYNEKQQREMAGGPLGLLVGINSIGEKIPNALKGVLGIGLSVAGVEEAKDKNSWFYEGTAAGQVIRDERGNVEGKNVGGTAATIAKYLQEAGFIPEGEQYIEAARQGGFDFGKWGSGAGYSIADNIAALALSHGISSMAGAEGTQLMETMVQVIMSSEAASDTMVSALDSGKDPLEAALLSIGSGVIEAVTEKYSLDALFDTDMIEIFGDWRQLLKYLAKNAFVEGTEEVASDVLDLAYGSALSVLFDHKNEIEERIDEIMANAKANGVEMDEKQALNIAWGEKLREMGISFATGTFTGAILSTGNAAGSIINTKSNSYSYSLKDGDAKINDGGYEDTLIQTALSLDPDTTSYKRANAIYNRYNTGKSVSRAQIKALAQSVQSDTQGMTTEKEAPTEYDFYDKGQPVTAPNEETAKRWMMDKENALLASAQNAADPTEAAANLSVVLSDGNVDINAAINAAQALATDVTDGDSYVAAEVVTELRDNAAEDARNEVKENIVWAANTRGTANMVLTNIAQKIARGESVTAQDVIDLRMGVEADQTGNQSENYQNQYMESVKQGRISNRVNEMIARGAMDAKIQAQETAVTSAKERVTAEQQNVDRAQAEVDAAADALRAADAEYDPSDNHLETAAALEQAANHVAGMVNNLEAAKKQLNVAQQKLEKEQQKLDNISQTAMAELRQQAADEINQRIEGEQRALAELQEQKRVDAEVKKKLDDIARETANFTRLNAEDFVKQNFPNISEEDQKRVIRRVVTMQKEMSFNVDSIRNRKNFANALAKKFGYKLVNVDSSEGGRHSPEFNAKINDKTGEIYMDKSATAYDVMYAIMIHEITHPAENASTYKELADAALGMRFGNGITFDGILNAMNAGDLSSEMAQNVLAMKKRYDDAIKKGTIKHDGEFTYEEALKEIVADSVGYMIASDDAALSKLVEEKPNLARRILNAIKSFLKKMAGIEGEPITQAQQIVDKLEKALSQVQEGQQNTRHSLPNNTLVEDDEGRPLATELPGGTVAIDTENFRYSLNSFNDGEQATVRKALLESGRYTPQEVDHYLDNALSLAAMIAADRARLDFEADPEKTMLKPNAEYVKTLDASTLCAKRLLYQGTFDAIQHQLPNTPLLPEDLIDLSNLMREMGYEVPCGICYVESRRRQLGKFTEQWLESYDGEYKPSIDEVTTSDGLEKLRHEHPQAYNDFVSAMNKKGTMNPKVVQLRTDYRGEIRGMTAAQIQKVKDIGGLRVQSFSDFETPHLLDMTQAVMDMAAKGLTAQAYTKVPNMPWVFGDTGIKINLSLIGKGTGLDADGNLVFDDVEGMPFDEAMKIRDRYSENVGTILVGINDAHILAAMADPRIDFIIPFHKSGWSNEELSRMPVLNSYSDYTNSQNEKKIVGTDKNGKYKTEPLEKTKRVNFQPVGENGYWDFSKSGKENAEEYLRMCAEDGRLPKFSQFLVDNGDGSFSLQPDGSTDGYWKTLIDFKMYDNDGNGAPQRAVTPDINMAEAQRVLNEYTLDRNGITRESNNDLPVAQPVVERYVEEYKAKHDEPGIRYSLPSGEENAIYIKDGHKENGETVDFINEILDGRKKGETRTHKNLTRSQWVGLSKNGMVYGRVRFGDPIVLEKGTQEYADSLIEGTEYDIKDGETKYYYPILEMEDFRDNPRPITRNGNYGQYHYSLPSDTDYLVAVDRGDMDEAQRLVDEKADEAGYTIPGYHGTSAQFNTFDIEKAGENWNGDSRFGPGFYFAHDRDTALKWTDGVRVVNARLSMQNPLDLRNATPENIVQAINEWADNELRTGYDPSFPATYEQFADNIERARNRYINNPASFLSTLKYDSNGNMTDGIREFLTGLGYDGIITDEEMVAFSPEQIKNADTVTYDDNGNVIPLSERFDTSEPDIRYSLPSDDVLDQQIQYYLEETFNPAPEAEEDARYSVPPETEGTTPTGPQRQWGFERAQTSDEIDEQVRKYLYDHSSYIPDTNAEQINRAIQWIRDNRTAADPDGYHNSIRKVTSKDFASQTPDGQAQMLATLAMAIAHNDVEAQKEIADAYNREGTTAGQTLQARKIFRLMTPAGRVATLQKMIADEQSKLDAKGINVDLKFSDWIYMMAAAANEEGDYTKVREEAAKEIAEQLPANWKDRIRSIRMLSMLGNPRTHVRNFIGNALFIPAVGIKNKIAATMELGKSQGNRTKTLALVLPSDIREFARQDARAMKDELTGEAKYNEGSEVRRAQKPFGHSALQWLIDKNSNALEAEDWFFLRGHYRRALGGWMVANGYTVEQVQNDKALLDKGRAYAIEEAQKATYRDFNKLANTLNKVSREGGVAGFLVDAVLPFKKTPANILKRGIEYSPIGLMKSLLVDSRHLKEYNDFQNGKLKTLPTKAISPNQFFDKIGAGLSGSLIMAAGAILSHAGLLTVGLDDDEDKFKKLQGGQEYAIYLFGQDISFTLDWAAPMSMPFFVGAAVEKQFSNSGDFDIEELVDSMAAISEPVFNLSMLDGVNTLFKTSQYDDTNQLTQIGAKILSNYITSYVPSALGAAARTADPYRRRAYVESGKGTGVTGTFRYAIEQTQNKIPGLSQQNTPYRDIWGNPEETPFVEKLLENFILPGYIGHEKDDLILSEMERLYNITGDSSMIPKEADKTISISESKSLDGNARKIVLTDKQQETYAVARGQAAFNAFNDLMSNEYYLKADSDVQVALIKDVWSYANQVGMKAVADDYKMDDFGNDPVQTIVNKHVSKDRDNQVKAYKIDMTGALDANDFEAYSTCVEALHENGVTDKVIKEYIGDTYRDEYKAAYLAGNDTRVLEIEDMLDEVARINPDIKVNYTRWRTDADKSIQ